MSVRRLHESGRCAACGATGAVWRNHLFVIDYGVPGLPPQEPDTRRPDLCDACEYAQNRYEAAVWCRANPDATVGYPYADPPPAWPPVVIPAGGDDP